TVNGFNSGTDYFQRATTLDAGFGEAYAGLADCYSWLAYIGGADPQQVLPKVKEAAEHARALNDGLSEAHASLALGSFFEWHWRGAERAFTRAIALNPRNANAHHMFSHMLVARARFEESLRESRQALDLEPLNKNIAAHLAWHYYFARDYAR